MKPIIGITCDVSEVRPASGPGAPSLSSSINQDYVDAVVGAGGAPICVPLGLDSESLDRIYQLLDGLLLSGGDDVAPERYGQDRHPRLGAVHTARDECELLLTMRALREDLPVLGICRGLQTIIVAEGGSLYQDIPSQLPGTENHNAKGRERDHIAHSITIEPDSQLFRSVGQVSMGVNSFHHQAACAIPPSFLVSAQAADGIIEGIESPRHRFVVAVQCHPEGIWHSTVPQFGGLFRDFVDAARDRSAFELAKPARSEIGESSAR